MAIDASCFTATPLDLETCKWLDTQVNLERYLDPGAIAATLRGRAAPMTANGYWRHFTAT